MECLGCGCCSRGRETEDNTRPRSGEPRATIPEPPSTPDGAPSPQARQTETNATEENKDGEGPPGRASWRRWRFLGAGNSCVGEGATARALGGTVPPPGCVAAPRVPAGPAAAARHLHQPPPTGRVRAGTTGEQDPQGPVLLLGFSEWAAPSPLPPTSGAGGALQLSSSSVPRPTPQRVPGHNRVSPSPSGCPSPRPPAAAW